MSRKMISDKKRIETANRLRVLAGHREADKEDVLDAIGLYIGKCVDGLDPVSVSELADIIDIQTTELYFTDSVRTVLGEHVRGWECRECGQSCEEMYGSYEYCPHCGAKVVE